MVGEGRGEGGCSRGLARGPGGPAPWATEPDIGFMQQLPNKCVQGQPFERGVKMQLESA